MRGMTTRPNDLLVLTDQQRADTVGTDPDVLSVGGGSGPAHAEPRLPRRRGDAVRLPLFTLALVNPTRRSLLTGQTPATNGCPGWTAKPWISIGSCPTN